MNIKTRTMEGRIIEILDIDFGTAQILLLRDLQYHAPNFIVHVHMKDAPDGERLQSMRMFEINLERSMILEQNPGR